MKVNVNQVNYFFMRKYQSIQFLDTFMRVIQNEKTIM